MLRANRFDRFLENGSSKYFVAKCDDGKEWVIRIKKKDKNSKRLFSEYLAGLLALEFGLNRPLVKLVEIDSVIYTELKDCLDIFDENCLIGTATEFVNDIRHISSPPNINYSDSNYPQKNLEYLTKLITDKTQFSQLYAMKVFSEWIVLKDFHKYENLLLSQNHEVYFLDFDLAFMSDGPSDWNDPLKYDWIRMSRHQAPFWEGIIENEQVYAEHMERLLALKKESINIDSLPSCWQVPSDYLMRLLDFIFNNRESFIDGFKHPYEFRNDSTLHNPI